MKNKTITIFGGTGFLGTHVVNNLVKKGYILKLVSLNPALGKKLLPLGSCGQINLLYGNILNEDNLYNSLQGTDYVINLVGIMHTNHKNAFAKHHAQAPEKIAIISKELGVKKIVHISALGVDIPSGSLYARSKANGEKAVLNAFDNTYIVRPSIIFGSNDNFFNFFAKIATISPILPLIGGGKNKFQPVYVDDVAKAIVKILELNNTNNKIYELGGPEIYSFKELLQFILKTIGKKRILFPIPYSLANIKAFFLEMLPNPILTRDQIKLLKIDNLVTNNYKTFKDLKISPKSIETIVPNYLKKYAA